MAAFLEADNIPTDPVSGNPMIQQVMKRVGKAVWRIRAEPLRLPEPDGPLAWSLSREGELLRIPLLPYLTDSSNVSLLLGGMDMIQRYTEATPAAMRTHIILGDQVQAVGDKYRFWLGFAAQLQ